MPIPRRISQSALQAASFPEASDQSGAFLIPLPGEDEDEFAHVGELPSLMPPPSAPALRVVEQSPPSYRSTQMPAVRPSGYGSASGASFDDEDDNTAPLALDLQVQPTTHTSVVAKLPVAPPNAVPEASPPSVKAPPAIPLGRMSGTYVAAAAPGDPKPGIVAFAGYGIPPAKLGQMPAYAFRVLARRATLRSDLKIARMRRLPQREIELYEAALRCADEGTVTKGIAVVVSGIVGTVGFIAAIAAAVL